MKINKEQKKAPKVLVGFSGGVDSSVAALLLKKKGYDVIGAYIKHFCEGGKLSKFLCKGASRVGEEKFARRMAAVLGIKLVVLDFRKEYEREVIKPMIRDYARGLTPNPDVVCNKLIKFPILWKKALELKAAYIATGHYAKVQKTDEGYKLLAGIDKTKDQSYFLYELKQNDLEHTLFPLGDYTKKEVRETAEKNNFLNYNKPGTRGICFIGKMNMLSFLRKKIPNKKGKIYSHDGEFVGYHPGTMYFTIGQRIGPRLGIEIFPEFKEISGKRWYVAEKRKSNILIIAPEGHPALKRKEIVIDKMHLINPKEKIPKSGLKARIRHLGALMPGRLIKKKGKDIFILDEPAEAIAEGQAIVLYKGRELIGGGEIRLKHQKS